MEVGPGMPLEGELEISNAFFDRAHEMHTRNAVIFIKWEECTARKQELVGLIDDKSWAPDAQGRICVQYQIGHPTADLSRDLRFRYVMSRRGLALSQAQLMSYQSHETWVAP